MAGVLTRDAVYVAADSLGAITSDGMHGISVTQSKIRRASDQLACAGAGHSVTADPFAAWLADAAPFDSWDEMKPRAEDALRRINQRELDLGGERTSRMLVGGWIGGVPNILTLPGLGVGTLGSDYMTPHGYSVNFMGLSETEALRCWAVLTQTVALSAFDPSLFRRFWDAFVEWDVQLGGPAEVVTLIEPAR